MKIILVTICLLLAAPALASDWGDHQQRMDEMNEYWDNQREESRREFEEMMRPLEEKRDREVRYNTMEHEYTYESIDAELEYDSINKRWRYE